MKKFAFTLACVLAFSACEKRANSNAEEQNASNAPSITIKKGDERALQQDYWVSFDIYGNKHINFSPNNEQNDTTKMLGAVVLVRPPLQSINKAVLRGHLSKEFILKCSSCHDDYANGIIGPSLLDKSSDEIFASIKAYKNKTQKNVLMAELVKRLSDEQIKAFADEISEFNQQFRGAK